MKTPRSKLWRIQPTMPQEQELAEALGTHPMIAHLLATRSIQTPKAAKDFLYAGMQEVHDPMGLAGMEQAVARILQALEAGEHIIIYGDYDVDGITATSLLYRFFSKLDARVSYYIPERQSEGYGLHEEALQHLLDTGADLVITVDCGISSTDLVAAFHDRLDLIITDHHTPPVELPPALAVINPKQPHCSYPDKHLSGVGVAYKLCDAVWRRVHGVPYTEDTDLVALGTVADLVPLVGENRIFVREGVRRINACPQLGIDRLLAVAQQQDRVVNTGTIAFTLAPRLNAAGRVDHATKGVRLLITDDWEEAQSIAELLQTLNAERQQIERHIAQEAKQAVLAQGALADKVMVVAGEGWHPGVIGIVASRLVEMWYKPALVLSISNGIAKGSCRSIEGFDMYEALASAQDLLIQFGGHKHAAGFSIAVEHIDALRERLTDYATRIDNPSLYVPVVDVDSDVEADFITREHVRMLSLLEPYGMHNRTPVFSLDHAIVSEIRFMGNEKQHVKLLLRVGEEMVEAVVWKGRSYASMLYVGAAIRIAFQLQINHWRDEEHVQLVVQDIQLREVRPTVLTHSVMAEMYRILQKMFRRQVQRPWVDVELDILREVHATYRPADLLVGYQVCKELGLIQESDEEPRQCTWVPAQQKLDLLSSSTYVRHSS